MVSREDITDPKKFKRLVGRLIHKRVISPAEEREAWSVRAKALRTSGTPESLLMFVLCRPAHDRSLSAEDERQGAVDYRAAHPEHAVELFDRLSGDGEEDPREALRRQRDAETLRHCAPRGVTFLEFAEAELGSVAGLSIAEVRRRLEAKAEAEGNWERTPGRFREMDRRRAEGTWPGPAPAPETWREAPKRPAKAARSSRRLELVAS